MRFLTMEILEGGELKLIFKDGKIIKETSLQEIRSHIDETFK